jgi:hypothetical protein
MTKLYKQYVADFSSCQLPANHREIWTNLMAELKLENFMVSSMSKFLSKLSNRFLFEDIRSIITTGN